MKNEERLTFFLPSLTSGGAERAVVKLVNEAAARGYLTDLVLATSDNTLAIEVSPQVQIVSLNASRVALSVVPFANYIKRVRPGLIVSSITHGNVAAVLARLLSKVEVSLILCEHSSVSHVIAQKKIFSSLLVRFVAPYLYPAADYIVAVSQGAADDLAQAFGLSQDKITVIFNPVVGPEFQRRAEESENYPFLRTDAREFVLGVGRLESEKDFATLIEAFKIVSETRDIRLVLVGKGALEANLKKVANSLGVSDRVIFAGYVRNPLPLMKRCSVFVLSSRFEALPTVLIEAMACGAPVVSTDCPHGPREILENGKWGSLVPVGNSRELARAISENLGRKKDRKATERADSFSTNQAFNSYATLFPSSLSVR